jgi:hypothetical protein
MRNIPALTVLVIIIFSFASNYSVYSQNKAEKNYGFSISPQTGFFYGQALEYVYPESGETKGEFLSELKWDMKPVYYFGLQLNFGKINVMSSAGFFSSLSFKAGIPMDSGVIEDRDWNSHINDELTHFSSHTNRIIQFFSQDFTIGASIPVKSYLYINLFINSTWMRFAFTGRDGYGKYAREMAGNYSYYSIDDNPKEIIFIGDVISYAQDWLIFSPGLSVGSKILYPFSIDFSLKMSIFSYCSDQDEHREITYKKPPDSYLYKDSYHRTYLDYTSNGFFIEPAVCISYSFKRIEHSLEFSRRHIGKTKGITYVNENDTGFYLSTYNSGAGLSFIDMRYLLKFRF